MCFIKYVCRIPLRMTEEELLIGDDAIHGEEAYSLYDDVSGLVPSRTTEMRAADMMERMHHHGDKYQTTVLHGQDLESGLQDSVRGKENGGHAEDEIKQD